jgi:two-component system LytT family response regulator
LSYLLKPLNPTRFREVIQRARTLLSDAQALEANHERLSRVLPRPTSVEGVAPNNAAPVSRLVVKDGERYLLVKTEEIDWIASVGEYASLRARKSSYLIRMAISDLEASLDSRQFVRIHRSTIINLDRVREVQPRSHGDYDVLMEDGTVLRLSRTYRDNLLPQRPATAR